MLTVWRTLWFELDRMKAPVLPTDYGQMSDGFRYMDKVTYNSNGTINNATSQAWDTQEISNGQKEPFSFDLAVQPSLPSLTRTSQYLTEACIQVQGVSSDQVKEWSNKTVLEMPSFVRHLDIYTQTEQSVGRDIPVTANTESFWILHALGAFDPMSTAFYDDFDVNRSNSLMGYASPITIYIFNETIRDYLKNSLDGNPQIPPSQLVNQSEALSRLMYHETMHYFLGPHGTTIADTGIMNRYVANNFFLSANTNIALTPEQIRETQSKSQPSAS